MTKTSNHQECHCQGPLDACCSPVHDQQDPRDKSLETLRLELDAQARTLRIHPDHLLKKAIRDYLYPNFDAFETSPRI